MIGLVLNTPDDFKGLGLFDPIDMDGDGFGRVFDTHYADYPVVVGFCHNDGLMASAMAQALIDEGSSMVFHLYAYPVDSENVSVVNPISYRSRYIGEHPPVSLVRLNSDGIIQRRCVKEPDIPLDAVDGVYAACQMNDTPLLILYSEYSVSSVDSDDLESSLSGIIKTRMKVLGRVLSPKLPGILEDDFQRSSSDAVVQSFVPVTMDEYFAQVDGFLREIEER